MEEALAKSEVAQSTPVLPTVLTRHKGKGVTMGIEIVIVILAVLAFAGFGIDSVTS